MKELERESSQSKILNLKDELHKIAGSAGCYGFPEASKLARLMEQEILECKDPTISPLRISAFVEKYRDKLYLAFQNMDVA